ncbi:hypothetical protein JCM11251_003244 [Rhodosporidiobolus azoricus]
MCQAKLREKHAKDSEHTDRNPDHGGSPLPYPSRLVSSRRRSPSPDIAPSSPTATPSCCRPSQSTKSKGKQKDNARPSKKAKLIDLRSPSLINLRSPSPLHHSDSDAIEYKYGIAWPEDADDEPKYARKVAAAKAAGVPKFSKGSRSHR